MSTTDDLIALGCGAAVGKVFFWGLILSLGLVIMHPWILLIGLVIWYLSIKYGPEQAPSGIVGSEPEGESERVQADTGVNGDTA